MNLEALFKPESVVVVGASRSEGKVGHTILANLIDDGFQGKIIPVNLSSEAILGLPSVPSLKEVGQDIDLVIIALPHSLVKETVRECAKLQVKAVIVMASGFRETGTEGLELEQDIVDICRRGHITLLGPNCRGLMNTENQLNASFSGRLPPTGGVSIFSQSGALSTAMLDLAAERELGVAKLIGLGNKADITEVEILSYLAKDEQTKVIIGYLEDISTGSAFVKAAEEAALQKPVVILKSGTTAAGLKAAASHTGVLASADTAYAAAFKRSGVVRADNFESLFDYASALSSVKQLPKGNNVFILTNAGGPGIMAADAVEQAGMKVVRCDKDISPVVDSFSQFDEDNPIAVLFNSKPEQYAAMMKAAQADDNIDSILLTFTPHVMPYPAETVKAVAAAIDGSKPVVAIFMGGKDVIISRKEMVEAGLPDFNSPKRAVAALKGMREYYSWQNRPPRMVTRFRVNRRRVERILSRRQRTGRLQLGEVKGKDVLGAYGFHVPQGALASSSEEAQEIAERIGYPVAMKIVSPDIVHKSDLGGVFLNVPNSEAAEDTYELMTLKIRKKVPDARIEGVYVEQMVRKGLEVIIGMTRDPQFGPMLMFGLGGIFVEVMKDVTFHLAPITAEEAVQMLKSTRSYEMLQGRRGQEGVDVDAIASGLQRISQLTTDFPQILELDINPFIVGEFGSEPVVADARMTLAQLVEEE